MTDTHMSNQPEGDRPELGFEPKHQGSGADSKLGTLFPDDNGIILWRTAHKWSNQWQWGPTWSNQLHPGERITWSPDTALGPCYILLLSQATGRLCSSKLRCSIYTQSLCASLWKDIWKKTSEKKTLYLFLHQHLATWSFPEQKDIWIDSGDPGVTQNAHYSFSLFLLKKLIKKFPEDEIAYFAFYCYSKKM